MSTETKVDMGDVSDGYHTFNELYEFRKLYHAAFVNELEEIEQSFNRTRSVKSWRHSDGEEAFGGGWFIVVTILPGVGQISNHYEAADWDLFRVPEVHVPRGEFAYDGHTPADVLERLRAYVAPGA